MVSVKKIFFLALCLWEPINPPGGGHFGPQGLDSHTLCRGPLDIATYQTYKLWASSFQRFLKFSDFKTMGAIVAMTTKVPI